METYAARLSMQKRTPKRGRTSDEDNFSPPPCGAVPSAMDFQAKAREISAMCERFSLDAQELQTRLKTATEQVEQKTKELQIYKEDTEAALEADQEKLRQLTAERDALDKRVTAVTAEYRAFKTKNTTELEKFRRLAAGLTATNDDLRTQLQEQQTQSTNDLETERETVRRLTEERDAFSNARDAADRARALAETTINAACENFTDCITLQRRAGILLTSGQMLDLEGLLGIWLSKPRFNGDIWFPFECPLTKKTTTPVHELSTLDFIARLGSSLGMPPHQEIYFRYKAHAFDNDHEGSGWEIYTLAEQLQIFSKLTLAYHRRNEPGAGFTVNVKPNHTVSVQVTQNRVHDEIVDYEFAISLNVISIEDKRGVARQHAIQIYETPESANHLFTRCSFVYPEPPILIN